MRKLRQDPDISIWLKGLTKLVCGTTIMLRTILNLCNRNVPPKRGSNTPAILIFHCANAFNPHIGTALTISNLEMSPSIPIPPSAHPWIWMLNLLQQTQSSNFLCTHVARAALSDDDTYAVLHHPFSTTLSSYAFDIASLWPHMWVSGYAI